MTSRARRAAFTRSLRAQGLTWPQIARRIQAGEGVNKLVAMRWAHDYSQWDVAIRWNELWPPRNGTAGLNDKHISGWENWSPDNPLGYTVEPSMRTLRRLARIYECDVTDLADDVCYRHLDEAAPGRARKHKAGKHQARPRGNPRQTPSGRFSGYWR